MDLIKVVWDNHKKRLLKGLSSPAQRKGFFVKGNLVFLVTTRCNFNCRHCLRDAGKPRDLGLDLAEKILTGAKKYNFDHVTLTGGEPFVYPHLKKLVELISAHGYRFSFVTNGYNFASHIDLLMKFKEKISFVAFSLESHDEKQHDAMRQEGSYAKLMEDFSLCKKHRIPFRIVTAVSAANYDQLGGIAVLAKKKGASLLVLTTVLPCPRAEDNKLVLDAEKRQELFLTYMTLSRMIRLPIVAGADIRANSNIKLCASLNMTEIAVDPDGNIVHCCEFSNFGTEAVCRHAIVTTLKDKSFDEALKTLSAHIHAFNCRRIEDYKTEANPDAVDFNSCFYCLRKLNERIEKPDAPSP